MSLIEDDLLEALKELYESSKAVTSGQICSPEDIERYHRALAWSERVMRLAGGKG